eukprot:s532_g3.t1
MVGQLVQCEAIFGIRPRSSARSCAIARENARRARPATMQALLGRSIWHLHAFCLNVLDGENVCSDQAQNSCPYDPLCPFIETRKMSKTQGFFMLQKSWTGDEEEDAAEKNGTRPGCPMS